MRPSRVKSLSFPRSRMFFALRMAMSIIMTVYSATPSGSYVMWVTVIPILFAYAMSMWSYPMVRVDIMRTPPSLNRGDRCRDDRYEIAAVRQSAVVDGRTLLRVSEFETELLRILLEVLLLVESAIVVDENLHVPTHRHPDVTTGLSVLRKSVRKNVPPPAGGRWSGTELPGTVSSD